MPSAHREAIRFGGYDVRKGLGVDDQPLWQPSEDRVRGSNLAGFMARVRAEHGLDVDDFAALWRFSVDDRARFWGSVRADAGLIGDGWDGRVLAEGERMPGARWFPDTRLNFAENLLSRRDDTDAIIFRGEDRVRRRLSRRALYDAVSRVARALRADGVGVGDRVCGCLPNLPEAVIAMLATTSLGAVWSSCSPDFGVDGIVDRFGQIAPKVMFGVDAYDYGGKVIDCRDKLAAAAARMPSLGRLVTVAYAGGGSGDPVNGISWDAFIAPHPAGAIDFARLPFDHPVYILYSSGTTGVPKCIVHGAGGTLLQHVKEHRLHCDIKPGDRVFYFTTCGWMMWNWLVSALASEATLLLYDGSPFHPAPTVLFDYAAEEGMTLFGTSAKYIDALAKAGTEPKRTHDLTALRTMTSTGSPLAAAGFTYVYRAIKDDLHLASIAGGTDLISCFVLGDPTGPVWAGEIQAPGLGMAVDVVDDAGRSLPAGKGELVCTKAFPSMPVGFWNDPDGTRYHATYFARFPGVWHHGDFIERTPHGGFVIHGRSDATLNPGGVRIGTAEIYRQVESLPEVVEAVAVGQDWQGDVRVVLFVILRPGDTLDEDLAERIRRHIRTTCSPRHVPAKVLQVTDIPRTKNNKIAELAVRDTIHGRPIHNTEALANPEALAQYQDRPELRR
ncbi:MAG: acetoacetate--CoA ligase [Rhodospirillales bacterium]|nr:MAG: acetoacetate--CoA ligase [Rhodospirillales bacterium]